MDRDAHDRMLAARKVAADRIRAWESGNDAGRLAAAVESGEMSAWGAMVEIHVLPAVPTIDALCALRVAEAVAGGRWEVHHGDDAPAPLCHYCDDPPTEDRPLVPGDSPVTKTSGVVAKLFHADCLAEMLASDGCDGEEGGSHG
jgi:hypothetical protein